MTSVAHRGNRGKYRYGYSDTTDQSPPSHVHCQGRYLPMELKMEFLGTIDHLTLRFLIGNDLYGAPHAAQTEHRVSLLARSPSSCPELHSFKCQLSYLSTDVANLQQPLLRGCCDRIPDLSTQRRKRSKQMLKQGRLGQRRR